VALVPTTLKFFWPSTVVSIPANWVRDTTLDGYYLHAATGDTAGTTGGFATHTHTENSHTHSFAGGASAGYYTTDTSILPKNLVSYTGHTHTTTTSNAATETLAAINNSPSYYEVIAIKPNDSNQTGVPISGWALWDGASAPTNWTATAEVNSRLFKISADSATGGTSGGSTGSHAHSASAQHGHAATTSASSAGTGNKDGTDGASTHTHDVTLSSGNGASTTSGTAFPVYDTLGVIQNDTGSASLPSGIIGIYSGLIANIPADWVQKSLTSGCDMIMGTGTLGSIGTTGGALVHGHSGANHNHSSTAADASARKGLIVSGTSSRPTYNHTHTWTIDNTAPVINNTASKEHYPPYIEIILLKYNPSTSTRLLALTGVGT
jgi:hypothetical protein